MLHEIDLEVTTIKRQFMSSYLSTRLKDIMKIFLMVNVNLRELSFDYTWLWVLNYN